MKSLLLGLLVSFPLYAFNPPPSIEIGRNEKAVFVDFKSARYDMTFDVANQKAEASSIINFEAFEKGFPIFDLKEAITGIWLDGNPVEVESFSMKGESTVLRINKVVEVGAHQLVVKNQIQSSVKFSTWNKSVSAGFWMSDLTDRRYLEQYLPTNLEYDQYAYSYDVKISGTDRPHKIYTNGNLTSSGVNQFHIDFPQHFTTSSSFFHLTSENKFKEVSKVYRSIDGRDIPVTVYGSRNLSSYINTALKVIAELERDYGPWPHQALLIYGAGSGGMEYCGATISSLSALGHEMTHSYFARGVMPARGNAGWIDEAMASWRDSGYRQVSLENLSKTEMAGHSIYRRTTDRRAYSSGRDFLGYLDRKLQDRGGLKIFMKNLKDKRLFAPLLTSDFASDLGEFFGEDFGSLFSEYIYGDHGVSKTVIPENPMHPKLSPQDLLKLL